MKCEICNSKKATRNCYESNQNICSLCCGSNRNIKKCNSLCQYMPEEKYQLLPIKDMELTEVGRGKVILFSESLFLPNITECMYMNIEKIRINIKNPILISVEIKFNINKLTKRKLNMDELYLKDSWKREENKRLPFLQIYTIGTGNICNEELSYNGINQDIIIENNHIDTWLPNSKIENEKITEKDKIALKMPKDIKTSLVTTGKHFIGKNSTLLANIELEKNYDLKFDIEYDSIHTLNNSIVLNMGMFFPFELVNYNDYKVNLLNEYSFNKETEIQLLLPYENKEINCFLIPIENNNRLSSPKCIKYDLDNLEQEFHYDQYCILNHVFSLKTKENSVVNAVYRKLPIFTGMYDTFNKIYENEYAPVSITIFNNYDEIRKYKIEVEIQDLSYKKIEEIYVNPHSIVNKKIAPQLIIEKVNLITSNCNKNIYVKIEEGNNIIYENTSDCLIYAQDVFVEKLDNGRNDWKIDFRSFLARWVTPNSEEVDKIISNASKTGDIVGGTTDNSLRTEEDIKKIYEVLSNIRYSIRSMSFPEGKYHTQRISLPKNTIKLNSGNCIDLSILLASCFEAIKLKPYIVLIPGHAFVRVKLPNENAICIEATCLGNKEYYEAVEIGNEKYKKYFNGENPIKNDAYMVDIALARRSQIYPMN
ncbi:MAG: hypothetical protein IKT41_02125 [Clostridia bacterium]|nr:hypothetical protein [Clostridia bacterium]